MSKITDRCAALAAEGYSVAAVMIARAGNNRLRVNWDKPSSKGKR